MMTSITMLRGQRRLKCRKTKAKMQKRRRIVPPSIRSASGVWWWTAYPDEERKGWTEVDYFRNFFTLRCPATAIPLGMFLKRAGEEARNGRGGACKSLFDELKRAGVSIS